MKLAFTGPSNFRLDAEGPGPLGVVPIEPLPDIDGVFSDFAVTPQPFTSGPGVQINLIPGPTTAPPVGFGLVGLALRHRR